VSSSGSWNNAAVWNGIFGDRWWTNLLDTPAVYTLELGVVGVLAALTLARSRSNDPATRQTEQTPASARVAIRVRDYTRYVGFVCRRPLSLGDRRHARLFGASDELFDAASSVLDEAYDAQTLREAAAKFSAVGADTVLVKLPAAQEPPSWIAPPCFRTAYRNTA